MRLQGIGAKTAKQLVQKFGSLTQIVQQLTTLTEDEQNKVTPLACMPMTHSSSVQLASTLPDISSNHAVRSTEMCTVSSQGGRGHKTRSTGACCDTVTDCVL
jgi:5'-3' exonuclease